MRETIILKQDDANRVLAILAELPIKHLGIVQAIAAYFNERFAEPLASAPLPELVDESWDGKCVER